MGLSHVDSILRRRGREGRGRVGYIDFGETIENLIRAGFGYEEGKVGYTYFGETIKK